MITTAHGFQFIFAPTNFDYDDKMPFATRTRVMFFNRLWMTERAPVAQLEFDFRYRR